MQFTLSKLDFTYFTFFLFYEKNNQFTLSKLHEIFLILRFIYCTKKKQFTLSKLYEILLILRFIYFTKKNTSLR